VGRFQHHCIGFNKEFGHLNPKDIEGKKVGVRTYAQTTGLWVRGILQHEYGVDLDKVTWMTVDEAHLAEYQDPANCERLPKGSKIAEMMLNGELAAAILGNDMPDDPRMQRLIPTRRGGQGVVRARRRGADQPRVRGARGHREEPAGRGARDLSHDQGEPRLAPESALKHLPPLGMEANRKGIADGDRVVLRAEDHPAPARVDELFDDVTRSPP
jgi:4,5-dihydroxyphthalate decarboxylase